MCFLSGLYFDKAHFLTSDTLFTKYLKLHVFEQFFQKKNLANYSESGGSGSLMKSAM